jgi:hypothetical protein
MLKTRVITAVATAVGVAGLCVGTAWAGGPDGDIDDTPGPPGSYGGMFAAVGSGTFIDPSDPTGRRSVEAGYDAFGNSAGEATGSLIAQCQADGGQSCSADMVTNDNLCIVVVADEPTRLDVGGAGVTIEAARLDAIARATANGTPINPAAPILISDCP